MTPKITVTLHDFSLTGSIVHVKTHTRRRNPPCSLGESLFQLRQRLRMIESGLLQTGSTDGESSHRFAESNFVPSVYTIQVSAVGNSHIIPSILQYMELFPEVWDNEDVQTVHEIHVQVQKLAGSGDSSVTRLKKYQKQIDSECSIKSFEVFFSTHNPLSVGPSTIMLTLAQTQSIVMYNREVQNLRVSSMSHNSQCELAEIAHLQRSINSFSQ
jgi:hypothetical protein